MGILIAPGDMYVNIVLFWLCLCPAGKGMTSLNAHCGPVDFLVATSSTLSPELLKRDSVADGPDSACGEEDRSDSSSQESLSQSGSSQGEGGGQGAGCAATVQVALHFGVARATSNGGGR